MPPKKPATKTTTAATKTTSKPASKTTSTTKPVTKTTKPPTKTTTPATKTTTTKDAPVEKKEEPVVPAIKVEEMELKQLGNILKPDPSHAGKWPCLLDPSERASTFLRYRDTNYLNVLSKADMDKDRIRLALLGGLRYGKPMVIDMGEVDKFAAVSDNINNVQDGLMDKILDKSILKEEEYRKLLKDSDGDEYTNKWQAYNEDSFVFIVFMTSDTPPPSAANNLHFIRIADNK